jgi:hypothetical protein
MIQCREQARHDTHGRLETDPENSDGHQRHASLKLAVELFAQDGLPRPPAAAASDPPWNIQAHLTVSRHGFTCAFGSRSIG